MTYPHNVRHGVAVLTTPAKEDNPWRVVGSTDKSGNPRDGLIEVVELLSAANFPFEIIDCRRINLETFLDVGIIKYSSVLILIPLLHLSSEANKILRKMSYDHGVSLVCALRGPVPNESSAWGIRKIGKTSFLWPLYIKIKKWPGRKLEDEIISKYHPWIGLAGVRVGRFEKLDFGKTTRKFSRLLKDSFIPFRKLLLDRNVDILAESKGGFPLAHSFKYGQAINYCFSIDFHKLLGRYNEMHRLFRAVIEVNSGFGMVSVDLDGTMALRIDDPGSCVSDYVEERIGGLKFEEWEKFGMWLAEKEFSASVMYTPRWVDDGNADAGSLFVRDNKVERRKAGQVFPSPTIKYFSTKKRKLIDHEDEFKGLLSVKEKGVIDIQSHGLTHLLPDHERWASSRDRNCNSRWYHEYYNVVDDIPVPKETQAMSMSSSREEIARFFKSAPCVLTPSGHKHGNDSDINALKVGYLVFSSDYTSYKIRDMIVRNSKVPGIFLLFKNPNSCFKDSGYPFVGIIHDEDLVSSGLEEVESAIHSWMKQGIKRVISLRELAASLCLELKSYFSINPASLRIQVEPPINFKGESQSHPTGTRTTLRIVLPEGFRLNGDQNILTENKHILSLSKINDRIIQLILRIEENLKLELIMPLLREP